VVKKLKGMLDQALGVNDIVLAEFILDLAKKSNTVADFEKALQENEAEFPIELTNNIYATITKMLPEYFKRPQKEEEDEEA